jgi:hypothetical protein
MIVSINPTMRGAIAPPTEDGHPAVYGDFPAMRIGDIPYTFAFFGGCEWGTVSHVNGVKLPTDVDLFMHRPENGLTRFDYASPRADGHGSRNLPVLRPADLLEILAVAPPAEELAALWENLQRNKCWEALKQYDAAFPAAVRRAVAAGSIFSADAALERGICGVEP